MTETLSTEQVEEILAECGDGTRLIVTSTKTVASLTTELLALRKRVGLMEQALKSVRSFVAVMFGRGPDAIIPETVTTPLGIPVKIGRIMRDVDAALPTSEPTS